MHSPFLRGVAQYFHSHGNFSNYCFVLPNHRSCTFFERELDLASESAFIMPHIMTITDFATRVAGLVPVPMVDSLFRLYKCYVAMSGNENYLFDKFVYWGNVLLKDFNDVDMSLVNPEKIFSNIRDLRYIQSNYLESDVSDIIERYLNISIENRASDNEHDEENFWLGNYNTDVTNEGEVKKEYMRLWNSMFELYKAYNEDLEASGLSTMGHIYRKASELVKEDVDLGHEKYVFVGFNALTASEISIFKRLSNRGKAMFFWDSASPVFSSQVPNPGCRYVKFFLQEFPQPHDFVAEKIEKFPSIKVIGVPTSVGQSQYASKILHDMSSQGLLTEDNAISTAVVLPDEKLFATLLNSLDVDVNVNVTMGYPLQSSDIASLMRVVAKLHKQARRQASGEWCYYRALVKTVLSHPIIKSCFGSEAIKVLMKIEEKNMFEIPQSMLLDTAFGNIFHTIEHGDEVESVKQYLHHLIDFCVQVKQQLLDNEKTINADDETQESPVTLQQAFVDQYIEVLLSLEDSISRYNLPPCESTIFFLVDKLSSMMSIPFEGEPLHGLQIMGMLETRCIDFDKVIILSCNERVLPRKFRSSSFISEYMRRFYGMSTIEDQESMWAYHFYRLISRASEVYMIHDTSTQSADSQEVTRYIPQLELIYKCDIEFIDLTLETNIIEDLNIDVPKTGHVAAMVDSYKAPGGKNHSASSINEFINCPLEFYFHYIERLSTDDSEADFMGASTFGTIVHDTLSRLYYPNDADGNPRQGEYSVGSDDIKAFIDNDLEAIVRHEVNSLYLHNSDLDRPLRGEASITSVAIINTIKGALQHDMDLLRKNGGGSFTVLECEKKHRNIQLSYGGERFNFTFTADRIDRLPDGTLRIVDYKTGSDLTNFRTMEDLFDPTVSDRRKAVLQLMLYCNAYAQETGYDGAIKPVIYKLREMDKSGVFFGKGNKKQEVDDYRKYNDDFKASMDAVMRDFFDKKRCFSQTLNTNPKGRPCRYCKFMDFCRR